VGDDRITPHDRLPRIEVRYRRTALLGVAEKTVRAQLHRARRKLFMQLGADHPFTRGDGEGASP
jgi:hypothetical protein